jgi:hypothetical protein
MRFLVGGFTLHLRGLLIQIPSGQKLPKTHAGCKTSWIIVSTLGVTKSSVVVLKTKAVKLGFF